MTDEFDLAPGGRAEFKGGNHFRLDECDGVVYCEFLRANQRVHDEDFRAGSWYGNGEPMPDGLPQYDSVRVTNRTGVNVTGRVVIGEQRSGSDRTAGTVAVNNTGNNPVPVDQIKKERAYFNFLISRERQEATAGVNLNSGNSIGADLLCKPGFRTVITSFKPIHFYNQSWQFTFAKIKGARAGAFHDWFDVSETGHFGTDILSPGNDTAEAYNGSSAEWLRLALNKPFNPALYSGIPASMKNRIIFPAGYLETARVVLERPAVADPEDGLVMILSNVSGNSAPGSIVVSGYIEAI